VIAASDASASASAIEARLVWMAEERLVPHRSYWLKIGAQTVSASIARVGQRVDIEGAGGASGDGLGLNDIASVEIDLDRPIAAVPYAQSRALGGFVLIDKIGNATVAAGMIAGLPEAAPATRWRDERILRVSGRSAEERLARGRELEGRLRDAGQPSFLLSEAVLREGLCRDLAADDEHQLARRAGEVARLMQRAGVTVILAVPAPEGVPMPGVEAADGDPTDWVI
jgi:bifunctional enzyme CysN/CysC